jgi:uncharacterized protein YjiS (DUF1127 family)
MSHGSLDARVFNLPARSIDGAAKRVFIVRRVLHNLSLWHARARARHNLAMLNDHILKDIGLTRVDVEREVRKSFWRE